MTEFDVDLAGCGGQRGKVNRDSAHDKLMTISKPLSFVSLYAYRYVHMKNPTQDEATLS